MKVIAVCLGNICRSPLAHGILEHLAHEKGLEMFVDSAGTASYHAGEMPCRGSVQIALEHRIDISKHKARQIEPQDLDHFDLVLAMDASNYNDLMRMASTELQKSKIRMVLNYSYPGQNRSVPDSYFTGNYREVFDLLYDACRNLIDLVSEKELKLN